MVLTHGIPPDFRCGVHLFVFNRHTPWCQSQVYRVTQLRTDGVHYRESAGSGPVNVKVVEFQTSAALADHHGPVNMRLSFSHPLFFFFFSFNLTYSRWTSSLPSCLWSQRIFPSLPGSRLTIFYRDASSALFLQLVNQWLNFTTSRSHAFRCERKNTNPTLVRIELTTSALLAGVQVNY